MLAHQPRADEKNNSYTIGICTSGRDAYLHELIAHIRDHIKNSSLNPEEVIIIASKPSPSSMKILQSLKEDKRFRIILESERKGKYEAINRILQTCSTKYLVLVNGDALPVGDSINRLLEKLYSDDKLAVVSGVPLVDYNGGIASGVVALMWSAHNEALKLLSEEGSNRHSCDELMAIRKDLAPILPEGTVNDGAYLSCWASANGYRVSYSPKSYVKVRAPKRLGDLIRQRRRISYGHIQVWRRLGMPPTTVESLAFSRPTVMLKIISRIIKGRPKLIISLFPAVIEELFSYTLAVLDATFHTDRHYVWRRYED